MTERYIFEKFDNLSEEELNTKSNKNVYVENDVMTTVIECCRGKKKRGERKIDGFKKSWVPRIRSQIKSRKHICERKKSWRIYL